MPTTTSTTPDHVPLVAASNFFDTVGSNGGLLDQLYGRWQDEKKYESIEDYAEPLRTAAEPFGVTIVRMNKRPFGCDFTVGGRVYRMAATARKIYYLRIK